MLAFRGNFTRVQGRHTIRAGAEYRLINWSNLQQGNTSGSYNFGNNYDQENNGSDSTYPSTNQGLSYASFLMGVQSNASASQQVAQSFHTPYYALYFGDTWRVTSKLTVIPGIRFEWEAGPVMGSDRAVVHLWSCEYRLSSG
jgi:outer membrane receptor protein involved in Fe transport